MNLDKMLQETLYNHFKENQPKLVEMINDVIHSKGWTPKQVLADLVKRTTKTTATNIYHMACYLEKHPEPTLV